MRQSTLVYSVENLLPHDSLDEHVDRAYTQMIIKQSAGLIVMAEGARRLLCRHFDVPEHVVWGHIPHRHFIGWYPNDIDTVQARSHLQIPAETKVLLFLGRIAGYKGVSRIVETFLDADVENSLLLIAGRAHSERALRETQDAVRARSHGRRASVRLVPGFVGEADLQVFFNAADAVAISYVDVPMNPGSVILAMSFAKPIWGARNEVMCELIGEDAFFGHAGDDRHDAIASLQAMLNRDDLDARGRSAQDRVRVRHAPDLVSQRFVEFYGALRAGRTRLS